MRRTRIAKSSPNLLNSGYVLSLSRPLDCKRREMEKVEGRGSILIGKHFLRKRGAAFAKQYLNGCVRASRANSRRSTATSTMRRLSIPRRRRRRRKASRKGSRIRGPPLTRPPPLPTGRSSVSPSDTIKRLARIESSFSLSIEANWNSVLSWFVWGIGNNVLPLTLANSAFKGDIAKGKHKPKR